MMTSRMQKSARQHGLLVFVALFLAWMPQVRAQGQPNIVLIYMDDLATAMSLLTARPRSRRHISIASRKKASALPTLTPRRRRVRRHATRSSPVNTRGASPAPGFFLAMPP